ncbi:MAG: hypothetical protein K2Q18_14225 [Bdellovibrionales bacterium]|nr:hypothetical protein [Bdellovibrionales bacterium]
MKNHLFLLILGGLVIGATFQTSVAWAGKTPLNPVPIDDEVIINPNLGASPNVPTNPVTPPTNPYGSDQTPPVTLNPDDPIKGGTEFEPGGGAGSTTPTIPTVPASTTVTGTCSTEKEGYTKVDQATLFYCDGSQWQVVLLDPTTKTCLSNQSGKYSITSDKKLEFCNGTNWLVTGNKIVETCTQEQFGKMKFAKNNTGTGSKMVQFCNGTNWLDTSKKQVSGGFGGGKCLVNQSYGPVCGIDNVLYTNSSYAKCAEVAVSHFASTLEIKQGYCGESTFCTTQVVYFCGSDGIDYVADGCGVKNLPPGVILTVGKCASEI